MLQAPELQDAMKDYTSATNEEGRQQAALDYMKVLSRNKTTITRNDIDSVRDLIPRESLEGVKNKKRGELLAMRAGIKVTKSGTKCVVINPSNGIKNGIIQGHLEEYLSNQYGGDKYQLLELDDGMTLGFSGVRMLIAMSNIPTELSKMKKNTIASMLLACQVKGPVIIWSLECEVTAKSMSEIVKSYSID